MGEGDWGFMIGALASLASMVIASYWLRESKCLENKNKSFMQDIDKPIENQPKPFKETIKSDLSEPKSRLNEHVFQDKWGSDR